MTMTLNMLGGAMDLDDDGRFLEMRTAGVRLRRVAANRLTLETTQGDRLQIEAAGAVEVIRAPSDEKGGMTE